MNRNLCIKINFGLLLKIRHLNLNFFSCFFTILFQLIYSFFIFMDNLAKGYNIELLGFGTLYLRFITNKSVTDPKKAKSNLVKSIVPAFRPSFTVDRNGKRTYDLIPNRISLMKYGEDSTSDGTGDDGDESNNSTPIPNPSDKDDSTGGSSDSGNTDTGDSGSGTGGDGNVNFE